MKIEIPQPCPADWSAMKISAIGRHCQQCEKTVVDFTAMSREEIVLYLLLNQGTSVCGRFRRSQLDYYHLEELITVEQLRKMPPKKAALFLTLACAVLASCQQPADNLAQDQKSISTEQIDNPDSNPEIKKDIVQIDSTAASLKNTKPAKPVRDSVVEVVTLGMMEMGEVIPLPFDTVETPEQLFGVSAADTTIYHIAMHMPEFPGGMDSLFAFINRTLRMPQTYNYALGKIYVRFVVETDGSITHPEILRSTTGAPEFDEEALQVIRKMPNWIPGKMHEKPVRTYYTMPINFK